jgi:hypothetical protein
MTASTSGRPQLGLGASARQVARLGAGGLALLFAFTTFYVLAFHAPRAKGLDVGVVGTRAQAAQLQSALDRRARGAFDVRRYDSESQARAALLGTEGPWSDWERVLQPGNARRGAIWLPAELSYEWGDAMPVWTSPATPAAHSDSWHPEDMLLLPLRGADGEVLAILSLDEPLSGVRPTDTDLDVLMAVADHAGLAIARQRRDVPAAAAA